MKKPSTTAAARYAVLAPLRQPYLDRARECAKLTLPALFPPDGSTPSSDYPAPWCDLGARGVKNLAAKYLLALFPIAAPFFRYEPDPKVRTKLENEGQEELLKQINDGLTKFERRAHAGFFEGGLRNTIYEGLLHKIVGGNVCLHLPNSGGSKLFPLDCYVVFRDPQGNLREVIIEERIAIESLPEAIQEAIKVAETEDPKTPNKTVEIHTWCRWVQEGRKAPRWFVHQEVKGHILEDTISEYPEDQCPFIPLRWLPDSRGFYGRSMVDDHYGPLNALDGLYKAITEGSLAMSQIIPLVKPSSVIQLSDLTDRQNGEPIQGEPEDVTFVQFQKAPDFTVSFQTIARMEQSLSLAFLLSSAIQRDAERVTAEEIRLMATELEQTQGGTYSLLTQELQMPLLKRRIAQMTKAGALPKLPKEAARATIVAGLQGIGRSEEFQRLMATTRELAASLTPELVFPRLKGDAFLSKAYQSAGLDPAELVLSKEEFDAQQQANRQSQMADNVAPEVVKTGGKMVESALKQQSEAPAA